MILHKYNLSPKRYPNHVRKKLAEIPKDGKRVIIVLCRKCEKLSSYPKTFPTFDFDSLNKDSAQTEILERVEKIAKEKCYLPNVRISYLIARLSENEYISFLDGELEDDDIQLASRSLMQAMLYEAGF